MKLTGATVNYLLDETDTPLPAAKSMAQVADLKEPAYRLLLNRTG